MPFAKKKRPGKKNTEKYNYCNSDRIHFNEPIKA